MFRCWIGFVVCLLLIPLAIPELHKEEKMLKDEFGEEYAAYQRRDLDAAVCSLRDARRSPGRGSRA